MNLSLRQRLEDGQPCLGVSLRLARTMDWAAIMRDAGYHWLFLDLEHGTMSFDTLSQMALAGIEAGIFPLVRTPDHDPAPMNRILSNGGMGIIAPHVETADQARAIARACRFAPLGERSVPGAFPALGYQPLGFDKGAEILNRETLVVVMIESPAALENVDEIAAVDGVDVLLVGASDLTFAMGLPSQYGHPRIREAMQQVADAARNAGKFSGFGGVADAALARDYMAFGHQLVLAGNDLAMVLRGARGRAEDLIG